nr:MFS transporter [Mycobacterium simiae]
MLVGFGGGAFYPLFATLTTDYFGENNNASNYGIVYSAKLVGSILGIGVGASVIDAWGYTGAYWVAAASALLSAATAALLRQPGRRAKEVSVSEIVGQATPSAPSAAS